MKLVGLTGSIGMGKTTVTRMFADLGAATWNADEAVHRLYAEGGAATPAIEKRFPTSVVNGAVDRRRLSELVLDDATELKALEEIVHPLVAADRLQAIESASAAGAPAIVLDTPLLFETGAATAFDKIVVVSAPPDVQRERVLSRPDMTEGKFLAILAKQTPDGEKRAKADYVIETGGSIERTRRRVVEVWRQIVDGA
ncbi:MAG: dephospho-CoA kinase [Alphaproteobacteria bacterium]|nr:dephospho-CoA kinase [Alphaproteobacteria bacterium]